MKGDWRSMPNRETRELEALLFLFRPYINKEAQPDYYFRMRI